MMSTSDNITKLPNSLVEMCVVVGMDDDTGLKYSRRSQVRSRWDPRVGAGQGNHRGMGLYGIGDTCCEIHMVFWGTA